MAKKVYMTEQSIETGSSWAGFGIQTQDLTGAKAPVHLYQLLWF
uniref:Cleavage and polyadenylation specificity factor n=1 Tax=Rhizophora mucronata TaxID=61149 RepID=A0A2P2KNB9_RHIMU